MSKKRKKPRRLYDLKCQYRPCGQWFQAKRTDTKYCSPKCRVQDWRERNGKLVWMKKMLKEAGLTMADLEQT